MPPEPRRSGVRVERVGSELVVDVPTDLPGVVAEFSWDDVAGWKFWHLNIAGEHVAGDARDGRKIPPTSDLRKLLDSVTYEERGDG